MFVTQKNWNFFDSFLNAFIHFCLFQEEQTQMATPSSTSAVRGNRIINQTFSCPIDDRFFNPENELIECGIDAYDPICNVLFASIRSTPSTSAEGKKIKVWISWQSEEEDIVSGTCTIEHGPIVMKEQRLRAGERLGTGSSLQSWYSVNGWELTNPIDGHHVKVQFVLQVKSKTRDPPLFPALLGKDVLSDITMSIARTNDNGSKHEDVRLHRLVLAQSCEYRRLFGVDGGSCLGTSLDAKGPLSLVHVPRETAQRFISFFYTGSCTGPSTSLPFAPQKADDDDPISSSSSSSSSSSTIKNKHCIKSTTRLTCTCICFCLANNMN